MNIVHLVGELVSPVEIKHDRNSKRAWAKAVIAVPRGSTGAIDFVPVTLRDREADMAARYLGDGSLLSIDGHIHSALRPGGDVGDVHTVRRLVWVIADRVIYLRLPRRDESERRP